VIGIIGGGAFGTALAVALVQGGAGVLLWSRSGAGPNREMARPPGVRLADAIWATASLADVAAAEPSLTMARRSKAWQPRWLLPPRRNRGVWKCRLRRWLPGIFLFPGRFMPCYPVR